MSDLLDLCERDDTPDPPPRVPDTPDFVARIARYFLARPNEWIDAHALMPVGGTFAFRTRVSDCRRRYGMTIDNRTYRAVGCNGRRCTVSEYRYVPEARS